MRSDARESPGGPDVSRVTEEAALARLDRMGGKELVRELASIFLEDMPSRFVAMHDALVRHDPDALEKSAHAMKSSSAQLGAERLSHACERVESAADRRDFTTAERWLGVIEGEYAAFAGWLGTRAGPASTPDDCLPNDRSQARPTIAVVEDNADNRLLVDAMLGDRFQLHEYTNGADALVGMRARRPDLVLLDVSLPGMDGVEVVSRIRRDATLADVPVVALTAHAMAGDRERYLAAGFDGYVAKPIVEERDLTDTVIRLLTRAGSLPDDVAGRDRRNA
jgi:CheY-like chemotaxis protein